MLKVLLKKQFMEVFRAYFYNAKKNKPRSKAGIIGFFLLYAGIMVGVLGGMFTALSIQLCEGLAKGGVGWLYFVILSGLSVLLGAFGSVFNTYSGLYLGKDNDLLLSMPIPVRDIVLSRLMNVYLLGSMYSAVVILPALIVYWIEVEFSAATILCGLVLVIILTLFVLILSCLLGWCVAKISLKLKNKSFVTVLASLAFIGAYYFFYFKAQEMITDLISNAAFYGERIKGGAYGLYLFGRIGEGDIPAAALFTGLTALLLAATWLLLKGTFLSIAISGARTSGSGKTERRTGQRSPFRAMLGKELARFTASPNYMLNGGLGILLIPAAGVLLLVKGPGLMEVLSGVFEEREGAVAVLLSGVLCMLTSMIDTAVPSVSLEGKSLWIYRSLPVESRMILRAKTVMQLLLSEIPMLFASACAAFIVPAGPSVKLAVFLTPLIYAAFSAVFASSLGMIQPNLNWTNEIIPIKQGVSTILYIFGSWLICGAVVVPYLAIDLPFGAGPYLAIWIAVFAVVAAVLQHRLDTAGARRLESL